MNKISFYKFDGASNDFVIMDFRDLSCELTQMQIEWMCNRRRGIGADGLIMLHTAEAPYHFEMRYYNSDGNLSSMCGNGGRCVALFAHILGLGAVNDVAELPKGVVNSFLFLGPDGPHKASITMWDEQTGVAIVRLSMCDVACDDVKRCGEGWFLNTGSPHYVMRVKDLSHYDVVGEGMKWRNSTDLFPEGTNVDFIEDADDGTLLVRTYERGVENETYACGTGVTAAAIVSGNKKVATRGGDFRVDFNATDKSYTDIVLTGPAAYNFKGEVQL